MGHKIFVSYKYHDNSVQSLGYNTTVRTYVDKLESYIDKSDHIFKGEEDGEDLSYLDENTIWEKLKSRIYDSSLTIIMISPKMKEPYKDEKYQWIPWEISYSLKEVSRTNSLGQAVTSKSNALLAIVLPNLFGSYNYFYDVTNECNSAKQVWRQSNTLFSIISNNLNNRKSREFYWCGLEFNSYIYIVNWEEFIQKPNYYIEQAYKKQENIDSYNICKEV